MYKRRDLVDLYFIKDDMHLECDTLRWLQIHLRDVIRPTVICNDMLRII